MAEVYLFISMAELSNNPVIKLRFLLKAYICYMQLFGEFERLPDEEQQAINEDRFRIKLWNQILELRRELKRSPKPNKYTQLELFNYEPE
ncbi:MAG TPA: hypothetical protein VK203_19630 [Nostocaceae cyanobacterium]|nr:hypothetical protein [Nostocaceae cyanobacterium]